MMSAQDELGKLRPELRYLRIRNAQLERAYLNQKKKNTILEEMLKERDKIIKEFEKERDKLTGWIDDLKKQKETYKGMVYKPNRSVSVSLETKQKRTVGGQKEHKGYGRKLPCHIDHTLHIFTHICPDCKNPLTQTKNTITHVVEDIPEPSKTKTIVTRYLIERQWCTTCKKEVTAKPPGVIPKSRLGINLVVQLLIWKYVARLPFLTMVYLLKSTYGVTISSGAIVAILQRTKECFGRRYGDILKHIRAAPVKHADETGWRIKGVNSWAWAFLTQDAVYYTIEETRGGGIARKILAPSKKTDVLVRDDYAGYKNLPLMHQSCWAHLLRKSHEEIAQKTVSGEMKKLHKKLKTLFCLLQEDTAKPFDREERERYYHEYLQDIQNISNCTYQSSDAKRIQTRIKNQGKNLLTALLYKGVSLTNNAAERAIRPLVVTRKISGGSRSDTGAETHAVNMSIIQTIKMRNQQLPSTLLAYLLKDATGEN